MKRKASRAPQKSTPKPSLPRLEKALAKLAKAPFSPEVPEGQTGVEKRIFRHLQKILRKGQRKINDARRQMVQAEETARESERTKGQIKESMGELLKFHKLSEAIASSHNVQGVLDSLQQLSGSVVPILGSGVFLFRRDTKKMVPIRVTNLSESMQHMIQEQFEEGVIDWVIRERSPAVVPDIQTLSAGETGSEESNFIIIPLIVGDRGIGVYQIYTDTGKSNFTMQQLELLALLANVAAVAIENSQLYEQMNRTIRELGALYETGKEVGAVLKPGQVYRTAIDTICRKLDVDRGWIFSVIAGQRLHLEAQFGGGDSMAIPEEGSPFHETLRQREAVHFDRPSLIRYRELFPGFEIQNLVCVPLVWHDTVKGLIGVACKAGRPQLEHSHLRLLRTMANQVSIAAENSRLYQELLLANENLTSMQSQLIQSGKLAALGQLAGGVAHEINNPLQIILGRVQMVLMEIREGAQHEELEVVKSETKRIASIVRGLLEFAREGEKEIQAKPVDMNTALQEALVLMRHQIEVEGVQVREIYEKNLAFVSGDSGMLKQVFLNILLNAKQAMPGGGTMTVKTSMEDGWVCVEISDTGMGIPHENLDRVFEPFFTSREKEGGSGLGLSISFGIIEKHGGAITVRSQVGQGSSFRIRIPAGEADAMANANGSVVE